ncbi:MAG: hypothetical protein ACE5D6_08915, partial [Candidatus Zixiibacteriota bacterium]
TLMSQKEVFNQILNIIARLHGNYGYKSSTKTWIPETNKFYDAEEAVRPLAKEEISHRRCGAMTALCETYEAVKKVMNQHLEETK